MIDQQLIRSLLSHDVWQTVQGRLSASLFAEDCAALYDALCEGHQSYGHDLTPYELKALWKRLNPVATRAEKNSIADLIDDIEEADPVSADIALDLIADLHKRELGRQIAEIGLEVSEGKDGAMERLTALLERSEIEVDEDEFGPPPSEDIADLIEAAEGNTKWKFNIPALNERIEGVGPGTFTIAFATPETGKTSFGVSLSVGPGGFADQGAKVLILGNEEAIQRTITRAVQCAAGMSKEQIIANPDRAKKLYQERSQGRMLYRDGVEWDLAKIERFLKKERPDIVIVDQADKVKIPGFFDRGHERLRELYRLLREMGKKYDCAVIGVSQASNDAAHKTRLTYEMMEGSKIGKAAEADLIIGIGKHHLSDTQEKDPMRFLTISKNKLSGWHGTVICQLEDATSRYVA